MGANMISMDTVRRLIASSAAYYEARLRASLASAIELLLLWDNLNMKNYEAMVTGRIYHFILFILMPRGFGPTQVCVICVMMVYGVDNVHA